MLLKKSCVSGFAIILTLVLSACGSSKDTSVAVQDPIVATLDISGQKTTFTKSEIIACNADTDGILTNGVGTLNALSVQFRKATGESVSISMDRPKRYGRDAHVDYAINQGIDTSLVTFTDSQGTFSSSLSATEQSKAGLCNVVAEGKLGSRLFGAVSIHVSCSNIQGTHGKASQGMVFSFDGDCRK